MLTKSLHTVTAATNVAAHLLSRDVSYATLRSPARLAADALRILGYDYDPSAMLAEVCGVDPTVTKVHKACEKLVDAVKAPTLRSAA